MHAANGHSIKEGPAKGGAGGKGTWGSVQDEVSQLLGQQQHLIMSSICIHEQPQHITRGAIKLTSSPHTLPQINDALRGR